jgi:hypothetical protein
VPPFRGEQRSDPRGAFLHLQSIDDARAALRKLDGRVGPGGEILQVVLSRLPALSLARLWQWAYMEDELKRKGEESMEEAYFEDAWAGLGFGNEQNTPRVGVERGNAPDFGTGARERPPVVTRGGPCPLKDQAQEETEDGGEVEGDSWGRNELRGDEKLEDALPSTVRDQGQRSLENSARSQSLRTHASHDGRGGV